MLERYSTVAPSLLPPYIGTAARRTQTSEPNCGRLGSRRAISCTVVSCRLSSSSVVGRYYVSERNRHNHVRETNVKACSITGVLKALMCNI